MIITSLEDKTSIELFPSVSNNEYLNHLWQDKTKICEQSARFGHLHTYTSPAAVFKSMPPKQTEQI